MCFSAKMSAALAASTLLAGAHLHRKGVRFSIVQLFLVFGLMELLQLAQWFVVADGAAACAAATPLNQLFTALAWVHVAFQPLSMNAYLFSGPGHYSTPAGKAKRQAVLRLCLASAVLTMARLPHFNPLVWLGPRWDAFAAHWLPELPTLDMAGKACGKFDALCGRQLCTYKPLPGQGGSGHLAWSLPLLPSTYFLPNAALHFFVFFMPGFVMGRHLVDYLMFPVLLLTGPLVSMWLSATPATTGAAAGALSASYGHEWPSVWCMLSVMQVALAFVREGILTSGKSGRAAKKAAALAKQGGEGEVVNGGGVKQQIEARAAGLRRRA